MEEGDTRLPKRHLYRQTRDMLLRKAQECGAETVFLPNW